MVNDTNNGANNMTTQETRARHFAPNTYLNRFFSEKQITTAVFEKTDRFGNLHIIDTEIVIEHISLTHGNERKQVEGIIRKIDFMNGDLNHFFAHLAEAIANR